MLIFGALVGNYPNDKIHVILPPPVWVKIDDLRLQAQARREKRLIEVPILNPDGSIRREGFLKKPCLLWEAIDVEVLEATSRVTSLARWFRGFIRAHHGDAITWPDGRWLSDHGEGWSRVAPDYGVRMIPRLVSVGGEAHGLIHARARREAQPASTVLRRLVRGVLGV